MTITIPIWVLVVAGVTVVWYALGYAFNNTILRSIRNRWMRRHRTGTVPDWCLRVAYVACGPVGWGAWVFDVYDGWRYKRRRAKLDAAD